MKSAYYPLVASHTVVQDTNLTFAYIVRSNTDEDEFQLVTRVIGDCLSHYTEHGIYSTLESANASVERRILSAHGKQIKVAR